MKFMHEHGDLPIPGIFHIDQPYHYEHARLPEANGTVAFEDKNAFGLRIAQQLEAKILELGPETVAAFIGEPIQGAGGVIIPPDTYWPEIQRICRKYDILICSDEVICGFGRTGNWWGCQTVGFEPDMITFAKGVTSGYIPLGGVLISDKVAKVIHEGGELGHGYTYSGHPVACAVGLENVALIRDLKMVETVRDVTGPRLKAGFEKLAQHPLVGLAETRGLMGGLVLVKNKATHEMFNGDLGVGMVCRGHCFDNGLVMRAVGDRMIIAPPLIMTVAQIDELLAAIALCLDKTLADITARGWMA
jgi:putrescine aminotransferase